MNSAVKYVMIVILALLGLAVGIVVAQKVLATFVGPVVLKDWQTRTVAGLTMESPGGFKERTLNFGEARKMMEEVDSQLCTFRGFEIEVMRVKYKPEIVPNLDGAVKGAVNGVAKLEGVTNLKDTQKRITISGKPAVRLDMRGERTLGSRSGILHANGLVIADMENHTLYQVEVVFDSSNPNGPEYAERLLKSVKLAP